MLTRDGKAEFRPEGDYSKDHEFKARELAKLVQRHTIETVYDDSEAVVEAASKLGVEAHLVGQGEGQGKRELARATN